MNFIIKHVKKRMILIISVIIIILSLASCSKQKNIKYKKLEDLNGSILSVQMDSSTAVLIKSIGILDDSPIEYCIDIPNAIASVLSNKSDAFITDYILAKNIVNHYEGLTMIEEKIGDSNYGYGFRKNDPRIEKFNTVIKKFKKDGSLSLLEEKWTTDGEKSLPAQNWRSTKKEQIVCGVFADTEPICYSDIEGNLKGFDIDFIIQIAQELNSNVSFKNYNNLHELESALLSGEVDMIASALTINDERLEKYSFTEGYMDAGSVAIVRSENRNTFVNGSILNIKNGIKRTFIDENRWRTILSGLFITTVIIVFSITLGLIIGILLFLIGYYSNSRIKNILNRLYNIHLLLPLSTWLLICYYLLFPQKTFTNITVAIIALSIRFSFEVYTIVTDEINSIPQSQKDAAISLGYNKYNTLLKIFIPQSLKRIFSSISYMSVYHVRDTSLVEFISVQDIQATADIISSKTAEPFIPIILTALVYIIFAYLVSKFFYYLGEKISKGSTDEEHVKNRIMKGIK